MESIEKSVAKEEKNNTKIILAVLVFSAFIGVFNETILNVALNTLMDEMGVTAATIQWIVTAYMIVVSVMVPITAFLIQSFKTKKLYLGAMTFLLIGTISAACSKSFFMLLISRMVQAVGTGMLIPIMMNTILMVTPTEKQGSVMGVGLSAVQLGPALGPTVSGYLLQYFSWHALFVMLIPFIALCMICGYIYLINVSELTKPKLDILSIILSTLGVGGIIYGLSTFSSGENIIFTIVVFFIGIISLAVFCVRQISLKEPMIEIRTFKYSLFSIGVILVMISMMTIFTMNVMLPIFLQGALKTTTFLSALVLLPATLCNGFVSLIGGRLYDKIGSRVLIPTGFAIITLALFILSGVGIETGLLKIIITYAIVCVGIGCSLSISQISSLNILPKEYYIHGVAISNTLQQVSAAIGSAVFIGIMSSAQNKSLLALKTVEGSVAVGFRTSVLALDAVALIGLCLAIIMSIKNKKK
ncbi:DHA2 family efflux MFS transporter permease subunit [Clostridium bornimense]|uniref:DHA2 family efflux MFS transporter permease subunit n=1 Tax=Clostridium bornimense TaxID=1216932 RepID=UPI0006863CD9|nr:DHA2 family efflux MFS transporter permease subunit [Clostridium bornimense]